MKLLSHGIIKTGNLVKSPPLNSRGIKRWHKRFFIFYDSCRALRPIRPGSTGIEQKLNNEAAKSGSKKRSKSFRDTVRRFTITKKVSEENNEKLEDLVLLYYESEEKERKGALPIGKIVCKDVIVEENKHKINGYRYVINFQTKERLFHLCAETLEEHKSWLKVFNSYLNKQRIKRSESIDSLEDFLSDKNSSSNDDLLHVRNNNLLEQLSEWKKQRDSVNSSARISYFCEESIGTFGYENLPGNKDSGYSDSTVLNNSTHCVSYQDEIDLNCSQQSSVLDNSRKCFLKNSIQNENDTFCSDDIYQTPQTHSIGEISSFCYPQTNPHLNNLDNGMLTKTNQNESNASFSDLYQIPYRDIVDKKKENISQHNNDLYNESDFVNLDHFTFYASPQHSSSTMNDEIENHRHSLSAMNDEIQKHQHSFSVMNNEIIKRRYSSSATNDEIENHRHSLSATNDEIQKHQHSSSILNNEILKRRYSSSTMNDETENQRHSASMNDKVQKHSRNCMNDEIEKLEQSSAIMINGTHKRRHSSITINNKIQRDRSDIYENVTLNKNVNACINSCSNENSSCDSHLNKDFLFMNSLSLHDDIIKNLTNERKDSANIPNYQKMSSAFYSKSSTTSVLPEHKLKDENDSHLFVNIFPEINVDENVYINSDELMHKSLTKNMPVHDNGDYMALDPNFKSSIEYDEDAPELPRKMSMHRRCSEPGKNTYGCKTQPQKKSCSQVENSAGFSNNGSEFHWAVIEKTKYEDVSRTQTFSGTKEFRRPVTKSFK
ncbi:uncharacterized protein LOC100202024 isoform X1 [Hydra vulgaris]|uniref:uncharacterized protein LOC100202024 isoform X1 n=1 Tax=Hydra vulgaris TaxID=6087 RepID=UPI001F5F06E8|nr:uncharacterized protein LOC100202024 [Hydra vulgaris]